jgi:short-subunit dehydrogenase
MTLTMKDREKFAVVTGGTSGIGYELVTLLAKDGYNLVIVARDEPELNSVSDALKRRFRIQVSTLAKALFDIENAFAG